MAKRINIKIFGENVVDKIHQFEKGISFGLTYGNYSEKYFSGNNNEIEISIKSCKCIIYQMFLTFLDENKIKYQIL